jgi:hypothetical protein
MLFITDRVNNVANKIIIGGNVLHSEDMASIFLPRSKGSTFMQCIEHFMVAILCSDRLVQARSVACAA